MRRANEARASVSEAEVAAFGEALIFGGLAPRIAGSTAPKGSKVAAFMLKKTLGVETATALLARSDKDKAMDEARCGCRDKLRGALRDVSKLLAAAEKQGGFLGGKTPDPSDINLGGAVYTVKALLDSGLADVDARMPPELERYLERWCRRDSWVGFRRPAKAFILSRGDGVHAIDATHRRFPAAQGLRHGPIIQRGHRAELREQVVHGRARRVFPG